MITTCHLRFFRTGGGGGGSIPFTFFVRVVLEAPGVGEDSCVLEDVVHSGVRGGWVFGSVPLAKKLFFCKLPTLVPGESGAFLCFQDIASFLRISVLQRS